MRGPSGYPIVAGPPPSAGTPGPRQRVSLGSSTAPSLQTTAAVLSAAMNTPGAVAGSGTSPRPSWPQEVLRMASQSSDRCGASVAAGTGGGSVTMSSRSPRASPIASRAVGAHQCVGQGQPDPLSSSGGLNSAAPSTGSRAGSGTSGVAACGSSASPRGVAVRSQRTSASDAQRSRSVLSVAEVGGVCGGRAGGAALGGHASSMARMQARGGSAASGAWSLQLPVGGSGCSSTSAAGASCAVGGGGAVSSSVGTLNAVASGTLGGCGGQGTTPASSSSSTAGASGARGRTASNGLSSGSGALNSTLKGRVYSPSLQTRQRAALGAGGMGPGGSGAVGVSGGSVAALAVGGGSLTAEVSGGSAYVAAAGLPASTPEHPPLVPAMGGMGGRGGSVEANLRTASLAALATSPRAGGLRPCASAVTGVDFSRISSSNNAASTAGPRSPRRMTSASSTSSVVVATASGPAPQNSSSSSACRQASPRLGVGTPAVAPPDGGDDVTANGGGGASTSSSTPGAAASGPLSSPRGQQGPRASSAMQGRWTAPLTSRSASAREARQDAGFGGGAGANGLAAVSASGCSNGPRFLVTSPKLHELQRRQSPPMRSPHSQQQQARQHMQPTSSSSSSSRSVPRVALPRREPQAGADANVGETLRPGAIVTIKDRVFEVKEPIGEGTFGVVWGARYMGIANGVGKETSNEATKVAIKEIVCRSREALREAVQEGTILRALAGVGFGLLEMESDRVGRVPTLVAVAAEQIGLEEHRVRLAMTHIPGESLNRFLDRRRAEANGANSAATLQNQQHPPYRRFAEACHFARELVYQLAASLSRISELAYHRDVNPRNILVDNHGSKIRYGLIDFGLAVDSKSWRQEHAHAAAGEAPVGNWQSFGVGGDCRYWPVSAWLMLEKGTKALSARPHLCLEYRLQLDLHALGITAAQVFADLSPVCTPESRDCLPGGEVAEADQVDNDEVLQSLWNVCAAWTRYWKDATHYWRRLFDAYRKSENGDLAAVKAEYARNHVHERILEGLRGLRAAIAHACEVCQRAPPEAGLEDAPRLLQALLTLISSGDRQAFLCEDSARSIWQTVEAFVGRGPDGSGVAKAAEKTLAAPPPASEASTGAVPTPRAPSALASPAVSASHPRNSPLKLPCGTVFQPSAAPPPQSFSASTRYGPAHAVYGGLIGMPPRSHGTTPRGIIASSTVM